MPKPNEPRAGSRAEEGRTHLQAAIQLYEDLEYEQALEKLAQAKAYASGTDDKASVAIYEGIILAYMNRRQQSLAAFREGLLLKRDSTLPLKVAPKVEQDFETVRADLVREAASLLPAPPITKVDDPPPQGDPQLPTAPPPPRSNKLAYTLIGSGAAVAGTGLFLGLSALSYNERKNSMLASEAVKARAAAGTQLSSGTLLLGGGLAVLGTGVVLLLLPPWRASPASTGAKTSLMVTPLPGGLVLGSTGQF